MRARAKRRHRVLWYSRGGGVYGGPASRLRSLLCTIFRGLGWGRCVLEWAMVHGRWNGLPDPSGGCAEAEGGRGLGALAMRCWLA
jgi:hypothetical protein